MTARRSWPGLAILAIALAVVAPLVLPSVAHSQVLYGSIVGQVTDPQKAALPGVAVSAVNTGTGLKLETVTDATGEFVFRNLLPGTYDITATLTGFKELKQTGLPVSAGNPKRVDLMLALGGMQESVTVTAETTLIKTEKADLNTELTSKAVTNLPLNQYRNYQALLNLVPGATPTQFQNAEIDTPGRSLRTWVNGVQPNSNTTRVDGAVSVNVWLPHHAGYIAPSETIDTVNVSTNNFDADTGMAAGAAQTVVTKSGTNDLHGSGFWYYNGDSLNANSYFNKFNDLAKPPLNHQDFGGTVGGPIIKNKLFYFGGYEKLRDRRGGQVQLRRADGQDAQRGLLRGGARVLGLQPVQPGHRRGRRRWPHPVRQLHHPVEPHQSDREDDHGLLPGGQHRAGPELERDRGRLRHAARGPGGPLQLRPEADVAAERRAPDLGQVLDAARQRRGQFQPGVGQRESWRHEGVRVLPRSHLDARPVARPRRQLRLQPPGPAGDRSRLRPEPRDPGGHPGRQRPERHPEQRPADVRQRLRHRRDAGLDAALPQGAQLLLQQRGDEGVLEARDPDGRRHRQAGTEPPAGRVRRLRPEGRLLLRGQRDRRAGLHGTPVEPVRRLPARSARLLCQGHADRGDDGTRVADRLLRPRPLASQREAHRECRPAPGVLPADDPCDPRHRGAGLQHLPGEHRRPGRRASGCRPEAAEVGTGNPVWARRTASTRTWSFERATA